MIRPAAIAVIGLFGATGCAQVGPDYERPEVSVSDSWAIPQTGGLQADATDLVSWWKVFGDPTLSALVARAHERNYSLEVAGLQVLEARAQLGIAIGSAYPQQQALAGGATRVRASKSAANTQAGDLSYVQYDVGANIGWELDFWGRFRSGIESADASFLASIANYEDVMVLLTAQVADVYATIRTLEERLKLARENLTLQRRSYDIAEVKFRNGEDSELDMQQALTLLLSTEATVPEIRSRLVQARNALATLLSLPTSEIAGMLGEPRGIPTLPESVTTGVPADLLRRRPDIRQAELRAMAQTHNVGIAMTELYPMFSLTGTLGLASAGSTETTRTGGSGLGELYDADSVTYSFGPRFRWNVLNYGRIQDGVRVQDARLQQLLVNYQNTVLNAAREVEDAMVDFLNGKQQTEILRRTVESARRSSELSVVRYREGFSSYQRVLDSQQSLFTQQQRYVDAQGSTVRSLMRLYKALGGGWGEDYGSGFVDEATRRQMQDRVDWGELLEPAATNPNESRGEGTFRKPDR